MRLSSTLLRLRRLARGHRRLAGAYPGASRFARHNGWVASAAIAMANSLVNGVNEMSRCSSSRRCHTAAAIRPGGRHKHSVPTPLGLASQQDYEDDCTAAQHPHATCERHRRGERGLRIMKVVAKPRLHSCPSGNDSLNHDCRKRPVVRQPSRPLSPVKRHLAMATGTREQPVHQRGDALRMTVGHSRRRPAL